MRIFNFDPSDYADRYLEQGWIHIPGGMTEEFHRSVLDFSRNRLTEHLLEGFAIKGKKEQARYEFPDDDHDYVGELCGTIATLCGLNRTTMTLSERHIQAYEPNAAPEPHAHKDRYPSQVSVGLSVTIPEESRLVLYPYDHRELNPFNSAATLSRSLPPDQKPEVVLPHAREVEIDDSDGDVVVFPGSTTWHLRRRSANSINLYFKLNDFGCDPLGEDPRTPEIRERTLAAVRNGSASEIDELVPVVGRRLDSVLRVITRDIWQEWLQAQLYGEPPFGISETQQGALEAATGERALRQLVQELAGGNGDAPESIRAEVLALAEAGALELVSAADAGPRAGAQTEASPS